MKMLRLSWKNSTTSVLIFMTEIMKTPIISFIVQIFELNG